MSYASFIARRYIKSRRTDGFISFITMISIFGVALGTAALIIALAILGGFETEITEKVVGFTSHVQVHGYQNQPLTNAGETMHLIESLSPLVSGVDAFVSREALIRSRDAVDGILLKGIDPATDVSTVRKYVVEGEYDLIREPAAIPKIVLGKRLASRLSLAIGDKATVFAPGRSGELGQMRVMQFRLTGVYESGMAEYDDVYAFTSLRDAQILLQLGEAVSGYDIQLSHPDSAHMFAQMLQDTLAYPHFARTVFQTYRNLFSWIELQKKPVPIILGLIIIVATVNVIGTLLMMVLGKTKDVGILRSLGATRWGITRIFLRQGLFIAMVGTTVGNVLAFSVCYAQQELKFFSLPSDIYFMTSVPIQLRLEDFLLVSAISIGLCVLCSFVPARLAARLDPVTAIRFM